MTPHSSVTFENTFVVEVLHKHYIVAYILIPPVLVTLLLVENQAQQRGIPLVADMCRLVIEHHNLLSYAAYWRIGYYTIYCRLSV
jgi:hypothetical protein